MVYDYFPRLRTRRGSQAGYTSGGEQQMCAIGRVITSYSIHYTKLYDRIFYPLLLLLDGYR